MPIPRVLLLSSLILLAFAGCGRPTQVYLRAGPRLNVDERGEAMPVDLRLYQLKSSERFESAAYDALWLDDRAVLGDDRLADPLVVTLRPGVEGGEALAVTLPRWPGDARHLGVLVLFAGGGDDKRRAVVLAYDADEYLFEVDERRLTVRER